MKKNKEKKQVNKNKNKTFQDLNKSEKRNIIWFDSLSQVKFCLLILLISGTYLTFSFASSFLCFQARYLLLTSRKSGRLYSDDHLLQGDYRDVFRTQSNIYDVAFFTK